MSLRDLQAWLLTEGIRDDLNKVVRLAVRSELDNLTSEVSEPAIETIEWKRLVFAGSILARSEVRVNQESALRIAVAAVTLCSDKAIKDAGVVLLGKLSNFRAASLAVERKLIGDNLDARLGVALRLEAQRREMDRSVLVESTGAWLQVNEFQRRFWTNASQAQWLSASAPTASGKTFLVLKWLIEQLNAKKTAIAIYLAPTRALVSEVETNLRALLGEQKGIEISSLPLRTTYDSARSDGRRLVMVLTQERLHLLANVLTDGFLVDLLIVDEAHKIGDGGRGVILQDAIERATRVNTNMKVVFISPSTQNPEELLTDAPATARAIAVDSDTPTVLQNLMLARQAPGKPKRWFLEVRQLDDSIPIGTLELTSTPSSLIKRLAFVAAAVGVRGGTLVYANGAADSENIAGLISQMIPSPDTKVVDPELVALAELARKGVHPSFRLASLVEKGVAFHFGNMPSLLRLEIERLFRSGKICFLVCTSTLVEGVNLSCRTIVVRGPRKGKGTPMDPHDFWNLAGRAGRWGDEFQGNIICLDPGDIAAWPGGVPVRSRYLIKRESDAVLELGEEILSYLEDRDKSIPDLVRGEKFEHVCAYLLTSYLRFGSIFQTELAKRHRPTFIAKLDEALGRLSEQIEIDAELASRHPGVSPVGMQRLLENFRSYTREPENLVPADVASDDSHARFITIFHRINATLYPAFDPETRINLYALIVVRWLSGQSLAEIIRRNIEWHERVKRSFRLPALIRQTMELVEQIARFVAPKYLSAYMDVLHLHYRSIGRDDLIVHGLDIGTQLEFGVSTRTLISLMELGLSRMSAVALYEEIVRDDLSQDECRQWVTERADQLEGMNIPTVIIQELRERLLAKYRSSE